MVLAKIVDAMDGGGNGFTQIALHSDAKNSI